MNERWSYALLLLVLLGHLFLLSTQQRAQGSRLEELLLGGLGPVGQTMVAASHAGRDFAESFRLAGSLRRENNKLNQELTTLRQEIVRLQGVEEKLERLSREANYTRPDVGEVVLADVVYVDQDSFLRTMVLYTGTVGTRRNQPVVTADGLVGRIVVPAGRYAKVLLLSDPSLQASAMIARTRQRGVIRGGDRLTLDNIPLNADVVLGDEVVTAGIDGIFPRGIPIGRVTEVQPGAGLLLQLKVMPHVALSSLDEVWILTSEAVPPETRQVLTEGEPP